MYSPIPQDAEGFEHDRKKYSYCCTLFHSKNVVRVVGVMIILGCAANFVHGLPSDHQHTIKVALMGTSAAQPIPILISIAAIHYRKPKWLWFQIGMMVWTMGVLSVASFGFLLAPFSVEKNKDDNTRYTSFFLSGGMLVILVPYLWYFVSVIRCYFYLRDLSLYMLRQARRRLLGY